MIDILTITGSVLFGITVGMIIDFKLRDKFYKNKYEDRVLKSLKQVEGEEGGIIFRDSKEFFEHYNSK